MGMTYTQATWVLFGLGLLVVEIVALVRGDPPLTDAMRSGAGRWMLWPALFGTFCGHFFGTAGAPKWGPYVLVALGALVLYRDLFLRDRITVGQIEVCILFLGLGSWLWGSR
jgi:uncharacterized protein YqgC (DUF456 family)